MFTSILMTSIPKVCLKFPEHWTVSRTFQIFLHNQDILKDLEYVKHLSWAILRIIQTNSLNPTYLVLTFRSLDNTRHGIKTKLGMKKSLTLWGRKHFLNGNVDIFIKISLKFVLNDTICSDNGLTPNRWQAMTWTNFDPVLWHQMASLGHNEILKWFTIPLAYRRIISVTSNLAVTLCVDKLHPLQCHLLAFATWAWLWYYTGKCSQVA